MHAPSPNTRDKVSNGRLLPKSVDLRSAMGRRFKSLLARYLAELGALGEADQALLRQAVALQLEAERLQADIVRGAPVDGDMLVRISSEARRALGMLRTKAAKAKPAGPSLAEYIRERYAEPADEPESGEGE